MEGIRAITAYTDQKENATAAAEDILRQLDLPNTLCRHAVGLLACHAAFVRKGIAAALCEKLPFDVLGVSCPCGEEGEGIPGLALGVLTSDHISFESALSGGLRAPCAEAVYETYAWAAAGKQLQPGLLMAFGSLPAGIAAAELLGPLEDASGGMPIFGVMCGSCDKGSGRAEVFYRGEWQAERMALLLSYGAYAGAYAPEAPVESIAQPCGAPLRVKSGMTTLHAYLHALGMGRMPGETANN